MNCHFHNEGEIVIEEFNESFFYDNYNKRWGNHVDFGSFWCRAFEAFELLELFWFILIAKIKNLTLSLRSKDAISRRFLTHCDEKQSKIICKALVLLTL